MEKESKMEVVDREQEEVREVGGQKRTSRREENK